ncbi:cationic amino acid transporter 4-like [Antedon mediterranea]|uniref:cationic amino acid transporter 4-like n=1 Tax=Antedon mediterranea TaxID=105859 RepID=UPI003AF924A5
MPRSNILANISRTKYLDPSDLQTEFKRCLTTSDLVMVGIGNMVGSGIYVLTGEVVKHVAGPSVIVSYIIAGLVSLMAAICYSEFGARVPKTGSAFMYAYVTLGELWAFLIGWNLILEYIVGAAAVASAWSGSFDQLLGNQIENITIEYVLNGEAWESPLLGKYPDFVAFVIVCILAVVVCLGASCSSNAMNIFVFLNVTIVITMFIISLTKADISNFSSGNGFFTFGFQGVMAGAAICFYAFVGFDVIALAAEEALTPNKSMPIASLFSVVFVICLYVLASITLILLVPYNEVVPKAAYPAAFKSVGYQWAEYVVGVGTLIGMGSTELGFLFAIPRSVYAMAIEGLLFPCFAVVSKRTQIPIIATLVFGAMSAILALLFDISALVEFLSIGTLMAYAMVAAAVIVVRYEPSHQQDTDDVLSDNDTNDSSLYTGSFVPTEQKNYGTLKEPFQKIPVISNLPPGRAVCICYFLSVVFQFLTVLLFISNDMSNWWVMLLAILFAVLAILTFIPIPLHNQNEDITTFKTPFVPYFPALSVLFDILLLVKLQALTWLRFIVWVTIGLLIYGLYGYHHSVEGKKRTSGGETKDYQRMTNDPSSIHYGTIEMSIPSTSKVD